MSKKIYSIATILTMLVVGSAEACTPNRARLIVCPPDITTSGKKTFMYDFPRDIITLKDDGYTNWENDYAFSFNNGNRNPVAAYLTMHLEVVRSLRLGSHHFNVYKLTDNIGLLVRAGNPPDLRQSRPVSAISLPQNQETKVFPSDNTPYRPLLESLGFAVRLYPVLLKPVSGEFHAPRTRVATAAIKSRNNVIKGDLDFDIYIPAITIRSTTRTCNLTSSRDVTLKFPTVSKNSFPNPNVGSLVYGATTDISLNCQHDIEVWATLSDVNNPANRTNTLSIESGTGKAQNVGIQLFKNNDQTPLSYGAQSSVKGNENSWKLSNSGDRNPSVKLTGYYVRTGTGDITPGDVNAQAVITFSYQ